MDGVLVPSAVVHAVVARALEPCSPQLEERIGASHCAFETERTGWTAVLRAAVVDGGRLNRGPAILVLPAAAQLTGSAVVPRGDPPPAPGRPSRPSPPSR